MSLKLYHETDDTVLRSEYSSTFEALSTFSWSLWVKFDDDVAVARLAYIFGIESEFTTPELNVYLECGNDGALTSGFVNSSATEREITAAAAFADATWYHIVYTCASGAQKLWVNGTVVASGTVSSEETAAFSPSVMIKAKGGYARTFQDIAIWNDKALTESDVVALRDHTNTPGGLGALAWWPLTATSGAAADAEDILGSEFDDVLGEAMDFYILSSGSTAWVDDPAEYDVPIVVQEGYNRMFVDYDNGLDANDGNDNVGFDCQANWDDGNLVFTPAVPSWYTFKEGDHVYMDTGTGYKGLAKVRYPHPDFATTLIVDFVWVNQSWSSGLIGVTLSDGPKRTIQAALTAAASGTGDHTVYLEPGPHVVDLSTGLTAECPSGTNPVVTLKSTPHRTGKVHIVNRKCRPGRSSAGY